MGDSLSCTYVILALVVTLACLYVLWKILCYSIKKTIIPSSNVKLFWLWCWTWRSLVPVQSFPRTAQVTCWCRNIKLFNYSLLGILTGEPRVGPFNKRPAIQFVPHVVVFFFSKFDVKFPWRKYKIKHLSSSKVSSLSNPNNWCLWALITSHQNAKNTATQFGINVECCLWVVCAIMYFSCLALDFGDVHHCSAAIVPSPSRKKKSRDAFMWKTWSMMLWMPVTVGLKWLSEAFGSSQIDREQLIMICNQTKDP